MIIFGAARSWPFAIRSTFARLQGAGVPESFSACWWMGGTNCVLDGIGTSVERGKSHPFCCALSLIQKGGILTTQCLCASGFGLEGGNPSVVHARLTRVVRQGGNEPFHEKSRCGATTSGVLLLT